MEFFWQKKPKYLEQYDEVFSERAKEASFSRDTSKSAVGEFVLWFLLLEGHKHKFSTRKSSNSCSLRLQTDCTESPGKLNLEELTIHMVSTAHV